MGRFFYTHKTNTTIEDIKKKIKDTLTKKKFQFEEGHIAQGTLRLAEDLYDLLQDYYKFNPSIVKSNFCDLWDVLHDLFHMTPSKKNEPTDKQNITWSAIFNASVVKPWCNVKRGMLTQLRVLPNSKTKNYFELFLKNAKRTQGAPAVLPEKLNKNAKRTQGAPAVLPEKLKQSFREISGGEGLLPPDEGDD